MPPSRVWHCSYLSSSSVPPGLPSYLIHLSTAYSSLAAREVHYAAFLPGPGPASFETLEAQTQHNLPQEVTRHATNASFPWNCHPLLIFHLCAIEFRLLHTATRYPLEFLLFLCLRLPLLRPVSQIYFTWLVGSLPPLYLPRPPWLRLASRDDNNLSPTTHKQTPWRPLRNGRYCGARPTMRMTTT